MTYFCVNRRNSRSIVLVGMMGAGKSSVGRCLQWRTGMALFDTDEIVTTKFRMPIADIFSKFGENKFREIETQALQDLAASGPAIVVTGGGTVLREVNTNHLKRLGVVVWLDADEQTLFSRATRSGRRPLLQRKSPRKAFAQMLNARAPLYAQAADIRIDTSVLTSDEVAVAILSKLTRYYGKLRGSTIPVTDQ